MAGCFEEDNKTQVQICMEFIYQVISLVHGERLLKASWYLPVRAEKLDILSYNTRVNIFWNIL
jgi:hypothetical protein